MADGEVHVSFAASSQIHSVQPIMPNSQFSNDYEKAFSNIPFIFTLLYFLKI